jgi:hypothetical protein
MVNLLDAVASIHGQQPTRDIWQRMPALPDAQQIIRAFALTLLVPPGIHGTVTSSLPEQRTALSTIIMTDVAMDTDTWRQRPPYRLWWQPLQRLRQPPLQVLLAYHMVNSPDAVASIHGQRPTKDIWQKMPA